MEFYKNALSYKMKPFNVIYMYDVTHLKWVLFFKECRCTLNLEHENKHFCTARGNEKCCKIKPFISFVYLKYHFYFVNIDTHKLHVNGESPWVLCRADLQHHILESGWKGVKAVKVWWSIELFFLLSIPFLLFFLFKC